MSFNYCWITWELLKNLKEHINRLVNESVINPLMTIHFHTTDLKFNTLTNDPDAANVDLHQRSVEHLPKLPCDPRARLALVLLTLAWCPNSCSVISICNKRVGVYRLIPWKSWYRWPGGDLWCLCFSGGAVVHTAGDTYRMLCSQRIWSNSL